MWCFSSFFLLCLKDNLGRTWQMCAFQSNTKCSCWKFLQCILSLSTGEHVWLSTPQIHGKSLDPLSLTITRYICICVFYSCYQVLISVMSPKKEFLLKKANEYYKRYLQILKNWFQKITCLIAYPNVQNSYSLCQTFFSTLIQGSI